MTTVAQNYVLPSYKGIKFPVTRFGLGFSHDLAQHKFLFKDERFVQPQGRSNLTWRASIPLSENHPNIKGLFLKTFPDLFNACIDGTPGKLTTPDLGTFRAACASLSYEITPQQLDGVTVEIEWVNAPELVDVTKAFAVTTKASENTVTKVDADYKKLSLQEPTVKDTDSELTKIVNEIRATNDQVLINRDIIRGKIDSAIFTARRMENIVASVGDVNNWGLEAQLRDIQLQMHRAKRAVGGDGNGPVKKRVLNETSVDELARDLLVSVESLYSLNPDLSASPIIPEGSVVQFIPGK